MTSFMVPAAGGFLRYHDLAGEGPPLIFIHGLGCASSSDYPAVAADAALRGRRMLLVDLLGSGGSDRPGDFSYSIADHAISLVSLIEALGLPELDLFGHSMGGAVAISAGAMLQGRLRRLVLGEPNLDPGGGVFSRRIAMLGEADYVASGHDELVRSSLAEGDQAWAASLSGSAPYAVHRAAVSLVAGTDPSWRNILSGLVVPRTLIVGEASLPYPDAENLQDICLAVVPRAGHSMAVENPSGLASAIAAAIA